MYTELDTRYLVLKVLDIQEALDEVEVQDLNFAISCIKKHRYASGRDPDKQYVVVSETMKCYHRVKQMVLDELNETTD